jgi:hypothetical protein
VFPYENISLEPFEAAVAALNPVVAVKVRSAAVHAALSEIAEADKNIYIDANTKIQVLETMLQLPQADKEQCGAFIRDERVLVVWSDSLDNIIPTCHDFEERLIKLLWRSRPTVGGTMSGSSHQGSTAGSLSGHSHAGSPNAQQPSRASAMLGATALGSMSQASLGDPEKLTGSTKQTKTVRTWYGRKRTVEVDPDATESRPARYFAPFYNGVAAGLSLLFICNGLRTLIKEWQLDGDFTRFALCAFLPLLFCVSLFFSLQIVQNLTMAYVDRLAF